jgi:predicted phage terminase large subunit-like protein
MHELPEKYQELQQRCLGSLIHFTRVFYKLLTGNEYVVHKVAAREAREITLCRHLTSVFRQEEDFTFSTINIQPGAGKSLILCFWVAWCYAHYPDCNFIYVSHEMKLAQDHTHMVKKIMELSEYKALFGVEIRRDSSAKGYFGTEQGGKMKAFGSKGAIAGHSAGRPNLDRFSGAIIFDDIHKDSETFSDLIRGNVIKNLYATGFTRRRGPNVPVVAIGQRLHEDDFFGRVNNGEDGYNWKKVILKTKNDNGFNLCPDVISDEELENIEEKNPYLFNAQYQQDPNPAGGALFKPEWFIQLDNEPEILETFITVDTAETAKTYNDATVFSFWGIYKIKSMGQEIDLYGLHWLDCLEIRVEPKDLEHEFLNFFRACMHHPVKPKKAAIEKKSTGVTLCSVLSEMQGLNIIEITRTVADGPKGARYQNIQRYVASKQVSFTAGARHINKCIEHMIKITANDTHRHDDIADTLVDAVNLALIDKVLTAGYDKTHDVDRTVSALAAAFNKRSNSRFDTWR